MNVSDMKLIFMDYMDDPRGTVWVPEKVLRFLNRGQEFVSNLLNDLDRNDLVASTDFTIAESENDVENSLPQTFLKVQLVERLNDNARPTPIQAIDFRSRDNYFQRYRGIAPSYGDLYYINASIFGIVAPSNSYTARLHYKRQPAPLTDVDDTFPEFPSNFHNAMVLHAVRLAKPSVSDADSFQQIYNQELARVTQSADGRDGDIQFRPTDPEDIW